MTKLFAIHDLPPGIDSGPLGCIIPAYAALLSQQGYTELSAHQQLRFLSDLDQWLHRQQIQVVDLSEQVIQSIKTNTDPDAINWLPCTFSDNHYSNHTDSFIFSFFRG